MKEQKEREEKHQREYGKPFPKDGPDPDFNISFALMNICENIKELNEWKEFTEMD
jgi:phosphopantetheinyl transferase